MSIFSYVSVAYLCFAQLLIIQGQFDYPPAEGLYPSRKCVCVFLSRDTYFRPNPLEVELKTIPQYYSANMLNETAG